MLVVGGPNGSGKTTLALEYASETNFPYLGADAFAASIDPDHPERAQVAAGRAFIQGINDNIADRHSFVAESTLSGLTMRNYVASAHSNGFIVSVAFLFVDAADVCVARVAERVRKGGLQYLKWTFDGVSRVLWPTSGQSIGKWPITGYCCIMEIRRFKMLRWFA